MTLKELFNHPVINLDKQVRYSNLKVMFPENVAEHSEIVANLAMIIAIELMKSNPEVKIDLKDIAYRGVIHDWGESVTCDVTTDVKYSNPELPKILEDVESRGLRKLFDDESLIHDINTARDGSIEGDIIMLADRLQALFKMAKEYMIQRTESWRISLIKNSMPAVKQYILTVVNRYYRETPKILLDLYRGIEEFQSVIESKIDFL